MTANGIEMTKRLHHSVNPRNSRVLLSFSFCSWLKLPTVAVIIGRTGHVGIDEGRRQWLFGTEGYSVRRLVAVKTY